MQRGKLIVIDGGDGSGKATQTALLIEKLKLLGHKVEKFDFPRYTTNFFGKLIGECLVGEHGDFLALDPKIASVLYGADRFESSGIIRDWLDSGTTVVIDRYTSANQIHQGGKISDPEKRAEFMQWLDTMEHGVFGIPRPDIILYLDVPAEISARLIREKQAVEKHEYKKGGVDQAENSIEHQIAAKQSAVSMLQNASWRRIACSGDGKEILSRETIHEKIITEVLPLFS